MEMYLQSHGVDSWWSMENGYNVPKTVPIDATDRSKFENNARSRNTLLCGLEYSDFTKVMRCTSRKRSMG